MIQNNSDKKGEETKIEEEDELSEEMKADVIAYIKNMI